MLPYNTSKLIIMAAFLAFLLNGCGGTYRKSSAGRAETPAPVFQNSPAASPSTGQVEQREEVPSQAPSRSTVTAKPDYANIAFVESRLDEYENKFKHWLEISEMARDKELAGELTALETECVQKLEQILTGYNLLLGKMQQIETVTDEKTTMADSEKLQQLDIDFLESRCNDLLVMNIPTKYEAGPETVPELSFDAAQKRIAVQMAQKNYQEALLAYGRLVRDFPDRKPALATRLNYGLALQYTGQIDAAAKELQNLLDSDDLSVEPLSLQRQIADLLLAGGNVAAAEASYEAIIGRYDSLRLEKNWAEEQLAFLRSADPDSEEMLAYMNLLRLFQLYDYRIDAPTINEATNNFVKRYSGSPVADSALRLKTFTVNQLKAWFGRQLVKIDALLAAKKYDAASEILKSMTRYYLPAELQSVVQKTYYDVVQAETQEMEIQRRRQVLEMSEQWDNATKLLDSQRYDSAISAFETLLGTEYDEQAKMKITVAANQAAGQMRKDAASLFIRAGKTSDPEQKKKLLLASHKLLSDILVKYPQTDLLDKVKQNIAILEVQMQNYDPTLLEEIEQANSAAMSPETSLP